MRIYIGFDQRTQSAFNVAEKTAKRYGCEVTPIYEDRLRLSGMLTRPTDRRGQTWDFNSDASQSTAFAIARFFTPLLAHSGWALFVDSDVMFMRDPNELMQFADESKAVMVVKRSVTQAEGTKMDGQQQSLYPRKNWSSVAMYNADHPANKRLNLTTLNQWPGRDLHAFGWCADDEIGNLPLEWNHLVGVDPKPPHMPAILHFTLGSPDMPGYEHCDYADEWLREAA